MYELFDTFSRLIELIINNLNERKTIKDKLFLEYLDKFYEEFDKTAKNYNNIYYSFYKKINRSINLENNVEDLKDMRQEFRSDRLKLTSSIEAMEKVLDLYGKKPLFNKIIRNKQDRSKLIYLLSSLFHQINNYFSLGPEFTEPEEKNKFPSLAIFLDELKEYREIHPERTTFGIMIQMYEFISLQDELYANSNNEGKRMRHKELIAFTKRKIESLEGYYKSITSYYKEIKLLLIEK